MDHKKLELALLIALCDEWLAHHSHAEIGSDPAKIRLMKRFAAEAGLTGSEVPESIHQLYRGIFMRSYDQIATDVVRDNS